MMPKRKVLILFTVVLATVALFAVTPAVANSGPCPCANDYPCDIDDFYSFMTNGDCGDYFNPVGGAFPDICEEITDFDFEGRWRITAIARSADDSIVVSPNHPEDDILFHTENCSYNWGLWLEVNFDNYNLEFRDQTSPKYSTLDPLSSAFKMCRLRENSNSLSHLPNSISLQRGDYVIAWNDGAGDNDYDDIFLAMSPLEPLACSPALQLDANNYRWCLVNTDCLGCPDEVWVSDTLDLDCSQIVDSVFGTKLDPEPTVTIKGKFLVNGEETIKELQWIVSGEDCTIDVWRFLDAEESGEGNNRTCITLGGWPFCF